DDHLLRAVLHALACAVIEDGACAGALDPALDAHDVGAEARARKRLLGRNPQARLALDVHAAVEAQELAVARARMGSAVRRHRINFTACPRPLLPSPISRLRKLVSSACRAIVTPLPLRSI